MTRAELLRHFHNKVVDENNPVNADKDDANYGCDRDNPYFVSGPFDDSQEPGLQWDDMVEKEVSEGYYVTENLKLLATDVTPEVVSWGIGEWWVWQLTIPTDATEPEHCSGVGSSGE